MISTSRATVRTGFPVRARMRALRMRVLPMGALRMRALPMGALPMGALPMGALPMRALPILALTMLVAGGCNQRIDLYQVEMQGTVQVAEGATEAGQVHVELFHASSGEGALAHPLEFIEQFEIDAVGEFTHTLQYPTGAGEGLVVYAWQDQDGDGVLCAPGQDGEVAGLVEVTPFPVHEVELELLMDQPCAGPEAMFPL